MYRDHPLLAPALSFAAGVCLSLNVDIPSANLMVALGVCAAAVWRSRYRRFYVLLLFCFLGCGVERAMRPGPSPELDAEPGEMLLLSGCVVEPPALSESREQFVVELEPGARVRVTKYIHDGDAPPALRYGQKVEVEAKVRKPRNFGNPGAFDFAGYLARRHVYWTAAMPARAQIQVLPGECGHRIIAVLYGLRVKALERVEQFYAGDAYAIGMLEALLVGESARLERAWADEFRRTGTYHAIVVSGLHVTVIAMAISLLLRLLMPHSLVGPLVTLTAIWTYAGMCGWQAPVLRSAAGFTLFLIGRFFYRQCRLLNLLAAMALLFLAMDPEQVVEASFQLTFFSVLALGALAMPALEATTAPLRQGLADLGDEGKDAHLAPRVAALRLELRLIAETAQLWLQAPRQVAHGVLRCVTWMIFWTWETVVVSAAIQVGLALPMILYFHRLSISGLSANLLVTPLLTMAVPSGLVAVATGWHWPVALTGGLVQLSGWIAGWHARWEPNWRVPDPPLWLAALFLASLAALALWRKRLLLVPALALLVVMVWHPFHPEYEQGSLELTMIDVGQGDALLVGFPDGRWMVVDGGGIPVFGKRPAAARMDIGEDVVSPYLLGRGIRRVDIVASTHQHDDHAAGLAAIVENFRPRELWAGAAPRSASWQALRTRAERIGAKVISLRRPAAREIAGVRIAVLAPAADYQPGDNPSNNDSLVLRLDYGAHRFLLTGDAEKAAEYSLLDGVAKTTVLKVGHHGSKTSSTGVFLDAAQPAIALISVGKDNLFRHPHPEVTRRLELRHTAVFRTDEWGLVTIRSDGKRLKAESARWGTAGLRR